MSQDAIKQAHRGDQGLNELASPRCQSPSSFGRSEILYRYSAQKAKEWPPCFPHTELTLIDQNQAYLKTVDRMSLRRNERLPDSERKTIKISHGARLVVTTFISCYQVKQMKHVNTGIRVQSSCIPSVETVPRGGQIESL